MLTQLGFFLDPSPVRSRVRSLTAHLIDLVFFSLTKFPQRHSPFSARALGPYAPSLQLLLRKGGSDSPPARSFDKKLDLDADAGTVLRTRLALTNISLCRGGFTASGHFNLSSTRDFLEIRHQTPS